METLRTVKARNVPEDTRALFLPYQKAWILDRSLFRLMEKSRQIGLSWSTAYDLVRAKSLDDCRTDAWVSSRDDIQARLFLEDCKAFATILNVAATDLGEQIFQEGERMFKAYVIEFANGKRIHSMSSNPDAQAGKRGDRVLDEFALHKDNRKLYSIAEPGLTWGGGMAMISTHRGAQNFFNELVVEVKERGNPKGISLHTVTLRDALDQGFLWKLQQKLPLTHPAQDMDEDQYFDWIRSRSADEDTFMQEYMCVPADDASAFLEWDLIAAAEYRDSERWDIDLGACEGKLYIGIDIGRHHDLTVIVVLEKVGKQLLTRRLIPLSKTMFAEQRAIIWPLIAHPKVHRVCFDKNGIGEEMSEDARRMFGTKVEQVKFTPETKEHMAYGLRSKMEDRHLRIPHEAALRRDLRAVRKETTPSGNIRFAADTGPDGHSDRFWAYALAVEAARDAAFVPMPQRFNFTNRVASALAARRNRRLPG